MLATLRHTIFAICLICTLTIMASAARLSPALAARLQNTPDTASVGVVIVAFNTNSGLGAAHLNALRAVGITKGITYQHLGMAAVLATAGQVKALAANSAVRSIWANTRLHYLDNETSMLTGVNKIRTDTTFTRINGGLPIAGQGNFSVVINDSGIDATHADLHYPEHVIQNVQIITDEQFNNTLVATPELNGFTPLLVVEGVPDTDTHVGHGTHCAGIVGASGQQSGGRYAGVAPGAKLIGVGSGAGLFILNALGGFEWSITNQFTNNYNIRVISNSWGGGGAFDPDDPINVASKLAHDLNIIVCFAAGNAGPGWDTMNPYAKAPWVIGVGAGTKEGGLAGFSSRGTPKEQRLADSDPNNDYDAPSLVAPGTGREFDANANKFSAAVISTRALSNVVANGTTDDTEIPINYVPFYTQISGTSMATPFVAGVAALMLDADPTLSPDDIKQIMQKTATRMPGYDEFEVGSGYINAYAAVDTVFNRSKNYGSFVVPPFNAQLTTTWLNPGNPETFAIDPFLPQVPGPTSANTYHFTVEPGLGLLSVTINFGNSAATDQTGNSLGLVLYPPGCNDLDCGYSSGLTLPVLDSPYRQVVVKFPVAGEWIAEVRGLRGTTVADQCACSPAGLAVPERVDGKIERATVTLQTVADIAGHAAEQQIRNALLNRQMDLFADGSFRPDASVTRDDFARHLMLNTPLRQSLGATAKFTDVTADLAPIAEAVTASGSTLRDWNFTPAGMMSASGSTFNPTGTITRLDLAVALVRALGQDAQAKALAGTPVTANYNGQTIAVDDNGSIAPALRGYVQIALNDGILQASFSLTQGPFDLAPVLHAQVKPADPVTRAWMAYALDHYRQHFVAGN
ncbi:MAG TPA: S8 family serine peptidase [Blastocatellia bacterium]|nr:S8 family serine peptidase [Blastocatellia bacterium]